MISVLTEDVLVLSFSSLSMRAGLLVLIIDGDYSTREVGFPLCGVDFKEAG